MLGADQTRADANLVLLVQVQVQDHVAHLISAIRCREHVLDVGVVKLAGDTLKLVRRAGGERRHEVFVRREFPVVGKPVASRRRRDVHVDHVVVGHEPSARLGHREVPEVARQLVPRGVGRRVRHEPIHHLVVPRVLRRVVLRQHFGVPAGFGPDLAPHVHRGAVAHALVLEVRVHHAPAVSLLELLAHARAPERTRGEAQRENHNREAAEHHDAQMRGDVRTGARASLFEAAARDVHRGFLRVARREGRCSGSAGTGAAIAPVEADGGGLSTRYERITARDLRRMRRRRSRRPARARGDGNEVGTRVYLVVRGDGAISLRHVVRSNRRRALRALRPTRCCTCPKLYFCEEYTKVKSFFSALTNLNLNLNRR